MRRSPSRPAASVIVGLIATAIGWVTLTSALAFSSPATGADRPPSARQIQTELSTDKAARKALDQRIDGLRRELDALRGRVIDLATILRTSEIQLEALDHDRAILEARVSAARAELAARRGHITAVASALIHLTRLPPAALATRPGRPIDLVRTAILLRAVLPAIKTEAGRMALTLADLLKDEAALTATRAQAAEAKASLDTRRRDLEGLVAERERLASESADKRDELAQHMAELAAQASDLRGLAERVERDHQLKASSAERETQRAQDEIRRTRQDDTQTSPPGLTAAEMAALPPGATDSMETPSAFSGLIAPVSGAIAIRFGENDRLGGPARGVSIAAAPGGTVVAPANGTILFAGPFRRYGLILIVEHGNGYHSLLAGLGRIDAAVGRVVAAGEPVGVMPVPADGTAELYFELRRNGQPTNPQRGFGVAEAKGHG